MTLYHSTVAHSWTIRCEGLSGCVTFPPLVWDRSYALSRLPTLNSAYSGFVSEALWMGSVNQSKSQKSELLQGSEYKESSWCTSSIWNSLFLFSFFFLLSFGLSLSFVSHFIFSCLFKIFSLSLSFHSQSNSPSALKSPFYLHFSNCFLLFLFVFKVFKHTSKTFGIRLDNLSKTICVFEFTRERELI